MGRGTAFMCHEHCMPKKFDWPIHWDEERKADFIERFKAKGIAEEACPIIAGQIECLATREDFFFDYLNLIRESSEALKTEDVQYFNRVKILYTISNKTKWKRWKSIFGFSLFLLLSIPLAIWFLPARIGHKIRSNRIINDLPKTFREYVENYRKKADIELIKGIKTRLQGKDY